MKTLFAVMGILACCAFVPEADAQSCRPAVLSYIVRDAKGKNLSEAELQAVHKQMRGQPADGVDAIALAADGSLVGYSAKETKTEFAAITYADAAECKLKIGEFTLGYAGKTMRLIVNLDIDRRTYVIDSLPFRNGTFKLDQKGLSSEAYYDQIVPAKRWKKISGKP